MDLGTAWFTVSPGAFLMVLLHIVIINLVLSGDNAVLIAMAVRSLPPEQRNKGFLLGAGAAVVLRVVLTLIIAELLAIPFFKLAGGIALLWVGARLFVMGFPTGGEKHAATLLQAVWLMLVADLTMSFDNVIAIAGASEGNLLLLIIGLGLSIPFVIFTSGLLSMLMDRYPFIIYIGAAILGRVGAGMMITDPAVTSRFNFHAIVRYGFEAFCALAVIVAGRIALYRVILADRKRELQEQPARQRGE